MSQRVPTAGRSTITWLSPSLVNSSIVIIDVGIIRLIPHTPVLRELARLATATKRKRPVPLAEHRPVEPDDDDPGGPSLDTP